jgi:hypothetical protein
LVQTDPRNLLVRVIVPKSSESREKIIRATNSQTSIPEEALRALDKIHRNIESYLETYQIYYDRRKNFYKNQQKPLKRIVTIKQMAQAVMSVVLHRPDNARGRPNDVIRNPEEYKEVFSETHPLNLYYFCISMLWKVESLLKSDRITSSLDTKSRLEVKFHVMMYSTVMLTRNLKPIVGEIARLSINQISDELEEYCADRVLAVFESQGATNKVAKSPQFLSMLKADLEQELGES